jgi:hypothetical protein
VGAGLNYLSGKFTGSKSLLSFSAPGINRPLELSHLEVGLQWETLALDFKAQVSKSFLILTPYIGLGASHAWSQAGYKVEADVLPLTADEKSKINDALEAAGVEDIDFSGKGFATIFEETGWSFRVFGGLSVNMVLFRLDLTGLYNIVDRNYGVTLGGRFQL